MFRIFDNFKILISLAIILLCVSFLAGFNVKGVAEEDDKSVEVVQKEEDDKKGEIKEKEEVKKEDKKKDLKEINIIAFGFDRSRALTDVIMVGHVDPKNNNVSLISVPRDLHIDFTKKEFSKIKKGNKKNRVLNCKLNEVYSLVGRDEKALEDVIKIVEVITGLDIDYIMKIQIDGFKEIVDSVGGVEYDVPIDMYYRDPYQDLYINLKKGRQVLNGEDAEGLVRYRKGSRKGEGYKQGDKQRVAVQQDFMKTMVKQVLAEKDFNKLKDFVTSVYNHVETNFGLVMVLEYADFFFNMDYDKIISSDNMVIIHSDGEKIDGRWYEMFSIKKARKDVKDLIEKDNNDDNDDDDKKDSKDKDSKNNKSNKSNKRSKNRKKN